MPRPSGRFSGKEEDIQYTQKLWQSAKEKGLLKRLKQESDKYGISVILDHILVPGAKKRMEEASTDLVYRLYNKGRACWDNTLTVMPNGDVKCCLFFDGQIYDNIKNKSLENVYLSSRREEALQEFLKYPSDKCPFLEKQKLRDFENKINKSF